MRGLCGACVQPPTHIVPVLRFLVFKANFHKNGPLWLLGTVSTLVVCLAYCQSLAEREYNPELFYSPGKLLWYTVLLMTAGGPSVGTPCTGWGELVSILTCLAGVVVLALTVSVVETKLALSEKASMALRWQAVDKTTLEERRVAALYIQKLWRMKRANIANAGDAVAARRFARRRAVVRGLQGDSMFYWRRQRMLAELEWPPYGGGNGGRAPVSLASPRAKRRTAQSATLKSAFVAAAATARDREEQMAADMAARRARAGEEMAQLSGSGGGNVNILPLVQRLDELAVQQQELLRGQLALVAAVNGHGQALAQATSALFAAMGKAQ